MGVRAVVRDDNIAVIYVRDLPKNPDISYKFFSALINSGANVYIISATSSSSTGDIMFTTHETDVPCAADALERMFPDLRVFFESDVSKITVFGDEMLGTRRISSDIVKCLFDNDVFPVSISTSDIMVAVIVKKADVRKGFSSLIKTFELEL